jgi:glycosyltransferase involved in cell wall biosynthesis
MRVLFLSNLYPPADRGGWEQWCQEVADAFAERGHDVWVLTSNDSLELIERPEQHVMRSLYLESDLEHYRPMDFFLRLGRRDKHNFRVLRETVESLDPDVIFIWGMWQLDPRLADLAEELRPGRVAHYLCGYWPIRPDPHTRYWTASEKNAWAAAVKKPLAKLARSRIEARRPETSYIRHAACVSQAVCDILEEGGVNLEHSQVIYGGIELDRFRRRVDERSGKSQDEPLRILYAGALSRAKGVDTLLKASALLATDIGPDRFQVTLIGTGHSRFSAWAGSFVQENGLENHVTIRSWIDHSQMAALLTSFDVLAFPSTWQEPLARMMMEGLAAGLALVSTTTGGTGEVLVDNVNSLTFEAGNEQAMARQLKRLLQEPGMVARLAGEGRRMAEELFDFRRMVGDLEVFVGGLSTDESTRARQKAGDA